VNSQTELQEATQATDELLEEQAQASSRVELLAGQLEAHQEEKDRVRTGLEVVLKRMEADTARCSSTCDSESSQLAQREASLADLLAEIDAGRQVLAYCRSTSTQHTARNTLTPTSCTQAESTLASQLSELKVLERAKIETVLTNQFNVQLKAADEEYQANWQTASAAQCASLQALEASASRLRGEGEDEVDEDDEDEAKEPVVPAASKAAVASRKSPRGCVQLRKSPRGGAARR
jgi:hypothetical protein